MMTLGGFASPSSIESESLSSQFFSSTSSVPSSSPPSSSANTVPSSSIATTVTILSTSSNGYPPPPPHSRSASEPRSYANIAKAVASPPTISLAGRPTHQGSSPQQASVPVNLPKPPAISIFERRFRSTLKVWNDVFGFIRLPKELRPHSRLDLYVQVNDIIEPNFPLETKKAKLKAYEGRTFEFSVKKNPVQKDSLSAIDVRLVDGGGLEPFSSPARK